MSLRRFNLLLLGVILLACAGCVPSYRPPTDAQRDATFNAYRQSTVAGEPIDAFLKERSALLVGGDGIDSAGETAPNYWVHVRSTPTIVFTAQAIAIDSRGYFLTADHCVSSSKLKILYRSKAGVQFVSARVVARLPKVDAAIISVNDELPATFEWAPDDSIRAGSPLVAIVLGEPTVGKARFFIQPRCMAGTVKGIEPVSDEGVAVQHTLACRPGDSGGASVDLDGRFVAITSHVTLRSFSPPRFYSVRPNHDLVSRLIEADVASQAAPSSRPIMAPAPVVNPSRTF